MTIPAYRLPVVLEKGAQFGPELSTIVQESVSGKEQRLRKWLKTRCRGDIAYGLREIKVVADQLNYIRQVYALFLAHGGELEPFRFRDWMDYQAADELFGTGNGSETNYQLIKTYDPSQLILGTPGSLTYVRNITLPVAPSLVIKVNNVATAAYTLLAGGLIEFDVVPPNGHSLKWTGEFDKAVRFATPYLPIIMQSGRLAQIGSIPIQEVLGEF